MLHALHFQPETVQPTKIALHIGIRASAAHSKQFYVEGEDFNFIFDFVSVQILRASQQLTFSSEKP